MGLLLSACAISAVNARISSQIISVVLHLRLTNQCFGTGKLLAFSSV